MKNWSFTALSLALLLLAACNLQAVTPAVSETKEVTAEVNNDQPITFVDICGFVNEQGLELGITNEENGVKWLQERPLFSKNQYVIHRYDWEDNQEHFSILFHDDKLLAGSREHIEGIRQPLPMDVNLGQIIAGIGEPDLVYGRLMWLECEGSCPYGIQLIYSDIGLEVSTVGETFESVKLEDSVRGVALEESMNVTDVLCFVPDELDTYLANAFTSPIILDPKYIHKWDGFGMIVPIPP